MRSLAAPFRPPGSNAPLVRTHNLGGAGEVKGGSMGAETWLTPAEAAMCCGVDISTIRRRLRKGDLPGARRQAPGELWCTWEIPLSQLVELGMCRPAAATPQAMASRISALEADLAAERAKVSDLHESLVRMEALYERQQQLLDRYMVGVA